jgi:HEAT repeat protein
MARRYGCCIACSRKNGQRCQSLTTHYSGTSVHFADDNPARGSPRRDTHEGIRSHRPTTDFSDIVRACAAYNLGVLGEDAAVPALLDMLKSRKTIDRDAALALGKIGSPIAIAGIQNALGT